MTWAPRFDSDQSIVVDHANSIRVGLLGLPLFPFIELNKMPRRKGIHDSEYLRVLPFAKLIQPKGDYNMTLVLIVDDSPVDRALAGGLLQSEKPSVTSSMPSMVKRD